MSLRRSPLIPILFGLVGTGILVSLGFWQLQRMEEKQVLISQIEAQMSADPVAVPDDIQAKEHHRLRVQTSGQLKSQELHVITSIKRFGPGFRVIAPMDLDDGRTIMVDLGFVPERLKDVASRPSQTGVQQVTGLLYWPDETDSYTPDPDMGRNIWFARDVASMAAALGTKPVLLVAETHGLGEWPLARPPGVDVPNRHLEYVLTWFTLAVVWVVMTLVWLRANHRRRG